MTLPRRGYRFVGPAITKSEALIPATPTVDPATKAAPIVALALTDKPSLRCSKCGNDNAIGAKFCEECATQIACVCASCGAQLSPTTKFCPACAHPTSAPQSHFISPETYTPKHLAQKILTSKTALEGERKLLTVLVADIEGSMELLADRDPDDARGLLDPVLKRMMDAVHHYEGTVNGVRNEGIMALFGAPIAHEDHAARACYAALRMREAVKRYADEGRRSDGPPLQIRVGISSGEVVVRSIGSDLRMDYSAVGRTTHLAARMEQLAAPGAIRLTAETLRLAEDFIEVNPLGPVSIKGLTEPVEAFELVGAGTARTRLEAAARRGLTRFVGRGTEMQQFRDALGRAGTGRGQVVAVVGEPGVGKSRLVWEVTHSPVIAGWRVLKAGSVSYGKATSYLSVVDLLKSYFGVAERDGLQEISAKVAGALERLDPSLRPALVPLLALLDVPVDDASWQALDPRQRRRRTLDGVRQVLLREACEQPLLLIFEDLHWIDGETQALLDGLVESLPAARLLLHVNYRPEYSHSWGSKTYYRQVRIDPLPPKRADELLDALLGTDADFGALKRLLVERTEANPLFLEESVRSLAETGALVGERGAYRLTRPVEQLTMPATVQAILAARIDRLAPEAKRLLQAAAVIGKDVPMALLLAIADAPEPEVRTELTRLQAAEFLYEVRLFPDLKYTFKHALTHDVAYGSLIQERRRTLHSKVVATTETLYAEQLAEHINRLAHHAIRGEAWEKAVIYLRLAGAKSAARSAYREAVVGFEDALDALRHVPESRERTEQAIDLHLNASGALLETGALAKSVKHADEARVLVEALGDQRRLAWVLLSLSNRAWLAGDSQRAIEVGERARTIAIDLGDVLLHARVNWILGLQWQTRGEYRRAVELLRPTVEALEDVTFHERFGAFANSWIRVCERLAWCLAELGEFNEAITRSEEAVRIALEVDDAYSGIFAYRSLGFALLRRGDIFQSISALKRGLELCRATQVIFPFDIVAGHLGQAYALSGRVAEGVSLIEEAVAEPEATGTSNHPLLLAYLGEAHLLAGRRDDALKIARHARDLARRQQERGSEAWVLHVLGEIYAHADQPELEPAVKHYNQALARAEELDMRPLVAHCHLGLGKVYRLAGNLGQAQDHLTIATAMYREMGMTYWLGQAKG